MNKSNDPLLPEKICIINYDEYDVHVRDAWFRGFREGYHMATQFGLSCQQCFETGEKVAYARAYKCLMNIKSQQEH